MSAHEHRSITVKRTQRERKRTRKYGAHETISVAKETESYVGPVNRLMLAQEIDSVVDWLKAEVRKREREREVMRG